MKHRARIGVVAALPEEIRPLQRRLEDRSRVRLGRLRAVEGNLATARLVTVATGDGAERAGSGLVELLDRRVVNAVLIIGIAGGLSDDLAVGDVVVAGRLTNGAGEVPPPDPRWRSKALATGGVTDGSIYSHSEIAIDPVAKRRLRQRSGEERGQVVDLESASYARAAAARRIPYAALRAVSDSSSEALPMDFNRYRKTDGSSDRLRVMRYAALHPSIVPELMQLRERLRYCARRLADLVEEILSR